MRRNIWELEGYQCSILGGCLGLKELKKLAGGCPDGLEPDMEEYGAHKALVRLCATKSPAAKKVNRRLNSKFAGFVRRFARAKDEQSLWGLWEEHWNAGQRAGAYWAFMTHPLASAGLRERAFGRVHMLAHSALVRQEERARRENRLEQELAAISEKYSALRQSGRERIEELERENKSRRSKVWSLAKELETLRNDLKISAPPLVRAENRRLKRSMSLQSLRLIELESARRTLAATAAGYEKTITELQEKLAESQRRSGRLEHDLLEALDSMESQGAMEMCDKAGTPECPGPLLCGKRILYVGGRVNLIRHYRELVKQYGAQFVSHDGGIDDSTRSLAKMVGSADAVVCPVDCVSHDACQQVKDLCKQAGKPLALLRSSGVSSLARRLARMAEPTQRRM